MSIGQFGYRVCLIGESMKELQGENTPPRMTGEIRMNVQMEVCASAFLRKEYKGFHLILKRICNDQYMSTSFVCVYFF